MALVIPRRKLLLMGTGAALWPVVSLRGEDDEQFVEFEEITEASRVAIGQGITWLISALNRDGALGEDIDTRPDIGCSSMAGLALMAGGTTPLHGPHSKVLRNLLNFVLAQVDAMPAHDINPRTDTQIQRKIGRHAHSFFAATFLAQILGECLGTKRVERALTKVVGAINRSQTAKGDWGDGSWAPTLGTVMGWLSLRAAHDAGLRVGDSAEKTAKHLIDQMKTALGAARKGSWMHTLYKNATGIRVLYSMSMEREEVAKKALEDVMKLVNRDDTPFSMAGGEEYLAFQLITDTMLQRGGTEWREWFPVVRDKTIKVQNRDGSWMGRHCITSRTFCTAAAVLMLNAPHRCLPIAQV